MEPRGGCCIARYIGAANYNMHKVDRIMLRYRPIAPKPPVPGSVSSSSSQENRDTCVKTGRGKRKYVRDNNNNISNSNKRCKSRRKNKVSSADPVVTLPLLPERKEKKQSEPIWLSFNGETDKKDNREMMFIKTRRPDPGVMGSYLTVECVTETWVDEYGLGFRNEEKMMNLENDTCPGIITDGDNRVVWANKAYREMVGGSENEMMVWLLMKQCVKLPVTCQAFTCRVSWVRCGPCGKRPITLPCDVWQINGGGFAWRLDVNAALSLGR